MNDIEQSRPHVFITGASGLLGTALINELIGAGFSILAHYHTHKPFENEHCHWVKGDFSSVGKIRDFIRINKEALSSCSILINNYGPITSTPLPSLKARDILHDYHHNVIPVFEFTRFFINNAPLLAVVNILFDGAGKFQPYKKIVSYAMAKNAIISLSNSFASQYPGIRFHLVKPSTMKGARVKAKDGVEVSPHTIASYIREILTQ